MAAWPTEIKLRRDRAALIVSFDNGERYELPAEYLRVKSPSAEVQGHSPDERKTAGGKQNVMVLEVHPIGNYAVRLVFDDMHSTGIYSWDYFLVLGRNYEQLAGVSGRAGREGSRASRRNCRFEAGDSREPRRGQRESGRQFCPRGSRTLSRPCPRDSFSPQHDHLGADADAAVEVDHVLVGHAEAARRYGLADGLGLVRAVDAVERGAEIHRARAERIVDAALHVTGQVGAPRRIFSAGGVQPGHSRLDDTLVTPAQVKPTRPTPMP